MLKKIIFLFLIIGFIGLSTFSWAQNPMDPSATSSPDPKDISHLKQSGNMFTVTVVPGDKSSKFYILGKEAAKIKIDNLSIEASLFIGENEKKLTLLKKRDYFTTSTPLKGDHLFLKLKNKPEDKVDEIKIKLLP